MTPQQWAALARMFMYPVETVDTSEPVDPRTAAEDRVKAFYDSCSTFERATLRWLLGVDGWTDAKALDVRQREWRRAK